MNPLESCTLDADEALGNLFASLSKFKRCWYRVRVRGNCCDPNSLASLMGISCELFDQVLDALKLTKPYQKTVQIQKDNFQKFIDCHGLRDLLELDLASLDGKDSDGKSLPSILVLGVGRKEMLAKALKGKAKIHAREQYANSKKYRPNKPRVAQRKLKCLLESFIVLPGEDDEDSEEEGEEEDTSDDEEVEEEQQQQNPKSLP